MTIDVISSATEVKETSSFMEVVNKLLVPYQAISMLKIPLAGYDLVKNASYVIKAPKYLKLYPLLKIFNSMGTFLDGFIAMIGFMKYFDVIGLKTVTAALGPIGGASVVLQLARGGTSIWSLYRVDRQWQKFQRLLGKSDDAKHEPTKEECEAAFNYITEELRSGTRSFDHKFFGLYKKSDQKKITPIFDRFKKGLLPKEKLEKTIKTLKERYIHKQVQHALEIALMIIGAIGTLILIFAPTPAAPAAWGLLAISGVMMLSFYLYKFLQKKQFHHDLKAILN